MAPIEPGGPAAGPPLESSCAAAAPRRRRYYARSFSDLKSKVFIEDRTPDGRSAALVCGAVGEHGRFVRDCWSSGSLRFLASSALMGKFQPVKLAGFEFALSAPCRFPLTFGYEWCGRMWQAASLAIVEALQLLLQRGLTLAQPDTAAIQFEGTKPYLVNPCGIAPCDDSTFLHAVAEIRSCFLAPLGMCAAGRAADLRRLLRSARGVRVSEVPELGISTNPTQAGTPLDNKRGTLGAIRDAIEAIALPEPETGWSRYYRPRAAAVPDEHASVKPAIVKSVIEAIAPATVLDLASNTGPYARLAAGLGATTTAVDSDETCVNRLFCEAAGRNEPILPLVMDLLDPSPGLGISNDWFEPAAERLAADLTMALAFSHHLVLSNLRLNFDQVAEAFARWTRRWLLVEFVPFGGGACNPYEPSARPGSEAWYRLAEFADAFRSVFEEVVILPSPPSSRQLLLCQTPLS